MSANPGPLTLWCLIEGDSKPFEVEVPPSASIANLKNRVHNKGINVATHNIDAIDLVLWKVHIDQRSLDHSALCRLRVRDSDVELKLGNQRVSEYWPEAPIPIYLNILVQLPQTGSSLPSHKQHDSEPPDIPDSWSPRHGTVETLYVRLMEYYLVQVRGTPGSGKTTLLKLLHAYILSRNPAAVIEVITMWPKRPETDLKERKKKQIKTFPFTDRANTYLLFDNGQNTYWDGELWEYFFKDDIVLRGRGPFVILFCSYGSPTSRPVHYDCGTPLTLVRCARMTLRADTCHHADHGPIGLLLSRPEFEEVIYRFKGPYCVAVCLDDDLRELLFDWTLGHVGAVVDILSELARQSRQEQREGGILTIKDFFAWQPQKRLMKNFPDLPTFSRGLPIDGGLQEPAVANVFRKLLTRNDNLFTKAELAVVEFCHRHGWIQSGINLEKVCYMFSSPLHATYASWELIPSVVECPFATVQDMTFAIIKKFTPSQLSLPSLIGTAFTDRPLEARYQNEFYHGLFTVTGGGVLICPELFSAPKALLGHINFFIPGKKWGVELTQEGSKLGEHSSRFGLQGAYGQWLSSGDMSDYILVDCRITMPQKPHPHIPNLFHAVFEDNFRVVTLLNNVLEKVEGPFVLLGA